MSMGAITQEFEADAATVMAIQAGVDMVLMPADFHLAAEGVIRAVDEGSIPTARIRESLVRILHAKLTAGMI